LNDKEREPLINFNACRHSGQTIAAKPLFSNDDKMKKAVFYMVH
jgi:hypothetical protein